MHGLGEDPVYHPVDPVWFGPRDWSGPPDPVYHPVDPVYFGESIKKRLAEDVVDVYGVRDPVYPEGATVRSVAQRKIRRRRRRRGLGQDVDSEGNPVYHAVDPVDPRYLGPPEPPERFADVTSNMDRPVLYISEKPRETVINVESGISPIVMLMILGGAYFLLRR